MVRVKQLHLRAICIPRFFLDPQKLLDSLPMSSRRPATVSSPWVPSPWVPVHHGTREQAQTSPLIPPRRRTKPVLMLHLSHSAGTFMCTAAAQHGEVLLPGHSNCNMKGDTCFNQYHPLSCTQRLALMQRTRATFVAIERGFEEDEVCELFDPVMLVRDPLNRMDSIASRFSRSTLLYHLSIDDLMSAIATRSTSVPPYSLFLQPPLSRDAEMEYFKAEKYSQNEPHRFDGQGMLWFDNALTRFLAANASLLHAPLGTINENAFYQAVSMLAKFKFVMTVEAMVTEPQAAQRVFADSVLNWTHVNFTNVNNHGPHFMTQAQRQFFEYRNRWDICLYKHTRCMFDNQWRTKPSNKVGSVEPYPNTECPHTCLLARQP